MLFKLSIKNIKKSIKDYGIYFFTLIFAVSMFYSFNSIDAQSSMLVLNNSKYDIISTLIVLLNYVSVFVSIVLGFLIVYSNNFLIRKRKKEIGLYQTLGMSKNKVSYIITFETLLIGIISLVVGLLVGVFVSQFLSLFVSKLFEVNMTAFKFVFSSSAFSKTILYFSLIFLLVVFFNNFTLRRFKLIDLIYADRKNETIKVKNKYLTIITFILSISLLGYAYYLLLIDNALLSFDYKIGIMLFSGAIGTFLLFYSLSGFILKVFERNKKLYYKELNVFTLNQINSKINSSVISTTVICLLLLLTIGMLSGSMSLGKVFNKDFASNNLSDFTVKVSDTYGYVNEDLETYTTKYNNIEKVKNIFASEEIKNYTDDFVIINKYYDKKLKVSNLMTEDSMNKLKKEYGSELSLEGSVAIIGESEYKNMMEFFKEDYIDINSNEYLLIVNVDFIIDSYKSHYSKDIKITINNHELVAGSDSIINHAYENYNTQGNDGLLVVSDEIINGLDLLNMSIVGNFNGTKDDEAMGDDLLHYLQENETYIDYRTRVGMEASSLGIKTMVIFLGLYLGITFAISSATVLAIKQLSESSDNKKRYKILNQIGADDKMINKALFTNIAITFSFPLIIALVHAYFGLKKVNSLLVTMGSIDLTSNILLTALFMIVVYGGYFLLTYIGSKRIIKK